MPELQKQLRHNFLLNFTKKDIFKKVAYTPLQQPSQQMIHKATRLIIN